MPEQKNNLRLKKSFENMIQRGAIPPSMLFSGPIKSGKTDFAINLMMALNCPRCSKDLITPCENCRNCRRIKDKIYPDFHIIEPDGKTIKIDQIRKLKSDLILKPYEAKKRIVLIKESDLLGLESGNALLKIMEEPPHNTHFVLTAKNYSKVLPTIRSRCHIFRFFPDFKITDNKDFFDVEKSGLDEEKINKLLDLTDLFLKNSENAGILIFISEYICAKKNDIDIFFKFIHLFFRDVIIYKTTNNYVYFDKHLNLIKEISERVRLDDLFSLSKFIEAAIEKLKGNVNSKILMESTLLKIQAFINE